MKLPSLSWNNVPSSSMPLLGQLFGGGDRVVTDLEARHLETLEGSAVSRPCLVRQLCLEAALAGQYSRRGDGRHGHT
jgi:hypothetical protein